MLVPSLLAALLALSPDPFPDPGAPLLLPPEVHVLGVAGARAGGGGVHAYGGVEGGWIPGRFGLAGAGHYGKGDGYTSLLAGGGPALGHPLGARLAAVLWAGGGWYREGLGDGLARDLPVAMGGATLLVPVGPVRLSLGLTGLAGRHSSRTAPEPIQIRSLRLTVGVGP
jgi:hypothetical protein